MNTLVVIFFFLLLYFYAYFTGKINKLEKEISDLKNLIKSGNEDVMIDSKVPIHQENQVVFQNDFAEIEKPKEFIKTPKKPDWSEILFSFVRQNILTIIGIFTLVIGIGYFVKYAIDKNWIGETTRFLIGIFTGFAIIATGFFIRKNYSIFSAIITGGGLSVLYLSITLAFQDYHLFSQNTAFIFLIIVTILAVAISYFYNSEVLIIFALIGGFGAPLMVSTGQSNYPFLFTYLSFLNLGMLAIAYLKNWKSIGWFAFFTTYIYVFFWLSEKPQELAIWFLNIFYIIFYAFALRNYFKKGFINSEDILLLVIINIANLVGITYLFKTLGLEPLILFPLIFAGINASIWLYELKRKRVHIYNPVFVGIILSLVTIGVALQFKTHLITSIWAIESVLLLYLWHKTRENIFKISFNFLLPLILFAEVFTWGRYFDEKNLTTIFNNIFLTGFLVSICFAVAVYFNKNQVSKEKNLEPFDFTGQIKYFAISNFYAVGLFEIIFQLQDFPQNYIMLNVLLYSIYFVLAVLILTKFVFANIEEKYFIFLILILSMILVSLPNFIESLLKNEFSYWYYLLYLLPLIYVFWHVAKKDFHLSSNNYRFLAFAIVYLVCFELSHLYLIAKCYDIAQIYSLQNHFNIFYLPMIWTVLAIAFIFLGLKKQLPEFGKIGFFLIILMSLKLYAYDVWKMDNISRIIAFIILGIILLGSSFTFQKLKGIIKNMISSEKRKKIWWNKLFNLCFSELHIPTNLPRLSR